MSGQTEQNLLNLFRNANQILEVGNSNPPNMSRVSDRVLNAASSKTVNLVDTTKVSLDTSDRAQAACAAYEGIEGLRRLQRDQANRSYYDAGCGWMYKPSSGITPEINRGALGNAQGPSRQKMVAGTKWYWDLDDAEKDISKKICSSVTKCRNMAALGKFTDVCGFCKTTGTMIPVEKRGTGFAPRYPNDASLTCEPQNIVARGVGQCPTDGFTDMTGQGIGPKNMLEEVYNTKEGFVGGMGQTPDDLFTKCSKGPLSRDCVVLAARLTGCSDQGSLVQSLQAAPQGTSYDSRLNNGLAFKAYQATANPNITPALLRDGSTSLESALTDFQNLLKNTTVKSDKTRLAARDLCLNRNEYDAYNFCAELAPTTVLNDQTLKCARDYWKQNGGTEKGTGFNTILSYRGKSWQTFVNYVSQLKTRLNSTNKDINVAAIREFIGVDTSTPNRVIAGDLPKTEETRGAETVWIDLGDARSGSRPVVILRSDMRLAKDGEVFPSFSSREQLTAKYRVPADNIALTTAFEIRPDRAATVQYRVTSDDGFMVGYNQNPFENLTKKDWGSWRYQGPTTYQTNAGTMAADDRVKNTIVTKWFQGGGLAHFNFDLWFSTFGTWTNPSTDARGRQHLYLTQEPLAPWLQYELCKRPNTGSGSSTGFFEKRWNGKLADTWQGGKPIWSFDVASSGGITYQTMKQNRADVPGGKGYMSVTLQSWWHTRAMFNFTAFKTITLLVRPQATLARGASVSIFQHVNFNNKFGTGLFLKNINNQYFVTHWVGSRTQDLPITMNQWNLIVLQYQGDQTAITNITCDIAPLTQIKQDMGRRSFLQQIRAKQGSTGPVLYLSAIQDRNNAGHLVLGGTSPNYKDAKGQDGMLRLLKDYQQTVQSFTGDIAWIHGFRNYLDTENLLKAEIDQTWISRWPRGEN